MKRAFLIACGLSGIATVNAHEPHLLVINMLNEKAHAYSGKKKPHCGAIQLDFLRQEGLQPHHYVYEIGCGLLIAGMPIMHYLNAGHYVAIEPNKWQVDQTALVPENYAIMEEKKPQFFTGTDFDVQEAGITFDYILSHSVISHAPLWQLRLFLQKCHAVLRDGGKLIFSFRLTTPNKFSTSPVQAESTTNQWQYPGNTFFHWSTIEREARELFSSVELRPDFTERLATYDSTVFHDWCILTK